jgi:hypothetical protein
MYNKSRNSKQTEYTANIDYRTKNEILLREEILRIKVMQILIDLPDDIAIKAKNMPEQPGIVRKIVEDRQAYLAWRNKRYPKKVIDVVDQVFTTVSQKKSQGHTRKQALQEFRNGKKKLRTALNGEG